MYLPFNHILLRFPYFSFTKLSEFFNDEDKVKKIFNDPLFQEAIYIASPVLYIEMMKYLENKLPEKEKSKIFYTLIRYFSRMCTRCTPFGLFSNVSIGEIDKIDNFILNYNIKKTVRLDNYVLNLLSRYIQKNEIVKVSTRYFPNTSLYELNNKLRYIEYFYLNNLKRNHKIVEIDKNFLLNKIIKKARDGVFYKEICNLIMEDGYEQTLAEDYVNQLIDNQVLISELEPNITGSDYLFRLVDYLSLILGHEDDLVRKLSTIQQNLDAVNNSPRETILQLYEHTSELICSIIPNLNNKILFQIDSFRETNNITLSFDTLKRVEEALVVLNKLTPQNVKNPLSNFTSSFYKKYEHQEVPLLEALDPTIGIGYPIGKKFSSNYILDSFYFPNSSSVNTPYQLVNDIDKILLNKLYSFNKNKDIEIRILDEDLIHLKENWDNFPSTLFTVVELINDQELALDSLIGSAGKLIGRFGYIDKSIEDLLREIGNKEKELEADHIIAEIVHLPESRVGNILNRPLFRDYEIAYLTGLDYLQNEVNQIYLSDLYLSIINGELKIKSKKTDKFIIPRLTTAHNYNNDPTPIYQFLCDYEHQGKRRDLSFSWGSLFKTLDFLPRVKYKNVILSPATWNISVKDIKKFFDYNDQKLLEKINNYRIKHSIPKTVLLQEKDHKLYVDFNSITSLKSFWDYVKSKKQINLIEFYFDKTDNPAIIDFEGNGFSNECIIGFYKEKLGKYSKD